VLAPDTADRLRPTPGDIGAGSDNTKMGARHYAKTHVFSDDDLGQVLSAPAGEDTFTKTKSEPRQQVLVSELRNCSRPNNWWLRRQSWTLVAPHRHDVCHALQSQSRWGLR
jgi:hypothetical protein